MKVVAKQFKYFTFLLKETFKSNLGNQNNLYFVSSAEP